MGRGLAKTFFYGGVRGSLMVKMSMHEGGLLFRCVNGPDEESRAHRSLSRAWAHKILSNNTLKWGGFDLELTGNAQGLVVVGSIPGGIKSNCTCNA